MSNNREVPPGPRAGDPPTQMLGPEWGVLELTKENAALREQLAACVAQLQTHHDYEQLTAGAFAEKYPELEKRLSAACNADIRRGDDLSTEYSAVLRSIGGDLLANLATAAEAYRERITEPLRERVAQLEAALEPLTGRQADYEGLHDSLDDFPVPIGDFRRADAALTTPPGDWLARHDDEVTTRHAKHVGRFLSQMRTLMIDPLDEGEFPIKETCEALLKVAAEQRDQLHGLAGKLAAAKAEAIVEIALELEAGEHAPEYVIDGLHKKAEAARKEQG